MKPPPINQSEFGARAICALIDDLAEIRKARSFERTDALRHVVKQRNER